MNYASRRMVELQMAVPPKRPISPLPASKKTYPGKSRLCQRRIESARFGR
jgi:hypothetical protein